MLTVAPEPCMALGEVAYTSQAGRHMHRSMPSICVQVHGMERQALESQLQISNPWPQRTIATTRMAAPFDMSALSNILNVRAARSPRQQAHCGTRPWIWLACSLCSLLPLILAF